MEEDTMAEKSEGFSPVGDLLSNSVEVVKKTWNKLLVLSLIGAGIVIAYIIVVTLLIGGSLLGGAAIMDGNAAAGAGLMGVGGILAVLSALLYIGVFAVFGAAMIKIVSDTDSSKGVGEYLKEGFGLTWPVFLVTVVTGLLALGGLGLLIIPGIAISILLSFSVYEVVVHRVGIGEALRNSATIVSHNFGAIALRWVVAFGISLVISFVLSYLTRYSSALSLLSTVVQVLLTWFFLAYWYLVYKEARAHTDLKNNVSIAWMYIVAALGWVIIVFGGMALGKGISALLQNPEFMQGMNGLNNSGLPMEDYSELYDSYNETQDFSEDGGTSTMPYSGENTLDSIIENSDMSPEEEEQARRALDQMLQDMQQYQEENNTSPGGAGM